MVSASRISSSRVRCCPRCGRQWLRGGGDDSSAARRVRGEARKQVISGQLFLIILISLIVLAMPAAVLASACPRMRRRCCWRMTRYSLPIQRHTRSPTGASASSRRYVQEP
jgi:hypothetical protein